MKNQKESINSGNTNRNYSNKVKHKMSPNTVIISVVVLLAALGIGVVIRNLRSLSFEQGPVIQDIENNEKSDVQEISEIEEKPIDIVYVPEPQPEPVIEPEPIEGPLPRNRVQDERNTGSDNEINPVDVAGFEDAMQWIEWFRGLPPEYRDELRKNTIASIFSLIQRWQYLPPEQIQAEREEIRAIFQGWYDLPTEERILGIQMMQQQIEGILDYQYNY